MNTHWCTPCRTLTTYRLKTDTPTQTYQDNQRNTRATPGNTNTHLLYLQKHPRPTNKIIQPRLCKTTDAWTVERPHTPLTERMCICRPAEYGRAPPNLLSMIQAPLKLTTTQLQNTAALWLQPLQPNLTQCWYTCLQAVPPWNHKL